MTSAPTSYRGPMRKDSKHTETHSQTMASNTAQEIATVEHVLSHKGRGVTTIQPHETLHRAVEVMRDERIGAVVVADSSGALVGILSERDIVRKLAETPGQTLPQKVEGVMTAKVETCAPNEALVDVLRRMHEGRFRHMPVLDGGKLAGIVTIGDVISQRLNEVEYEALKLKQMIVG